MEISVGSLLKRQEEDAIVLFLANIEKSVDYMGSWLARVVGLMVSPNDKSVCYE